MKDQAPPSKKRGLWRTKAPFVSTLQAANFLFWQNLPNIVHFLLLIQVLQNTAEHISSSDSCLTTQSDPLFGVITTSVIWKQQYSSWFYIGWYDSSYFVCSFLASWNRGNASSFFHTPAYSWHCRHCRPSLTNFHPLPSWYSTTAAVCQLLIPGLFVSSPFFCPYVTLLRLFPSEPHYLPSQRMVSI